jgi:hypothetical protein
VFAELAHGRFCRPRPTTVSCPLDELRQALVNITLEFSLHAANKAVARATFAKATPDKPPGENAKTKKAAAVKRKAAAAPALSQTTGPSHPRRSDGMTRRADSCSPSSNYMRC